MGTVFKHVADRALSPCGEQCNHCDRSDSPIYSYHGYIVNPSLAANLELAEKYRDIDEVCANCIVGGNLRKHDTDIEDILPDIYALANDRLRCIDEYHRTPDLCLFQQATWPICCGELTEYIGQEPLPGTTFDDYGCWKPHAHIARFHLRDFYPLKKIPVMHTMALFRCLECPKRFWIFQYSGLFWPGPV